MSIPTFFEAYRRYLAAFDCLEMDGVAAVGVKFVERGQPPPPQAAQLDQAYTWCYAVRQASRGEVPFVTRDTVGCIMAGIALGLVDETESEPLGGWRQ